MCKEETFSMEMSFNQMILFGIPEGMSIAVLAFILSKVKLEWKKVMIVGIVIPFSAYLLRLLPITFGVHSIVSIGLLFFMLMKLGQVTLMSAIINSLITLLFLIIFETITSMLIMNLFEITQQMIKEKILINMVVFYPHVILLVFTAFLINKKRG